VNVFVSDPGLLRAHASWFIFLDLPLATANEEGGKHQPLLFVFRPPPLLVDTCEEGLEGDHDSPHLPKFFVRGALESAAHAELTTRYRLFSRGRHTFLSRVFCMCLSHQPGGVVFGRVVMSFSTPFLSRLPLEPAAG